MFRSEGTASAEQDHAWYVRVTPRRPVCLQRHEPQGITVGNETSNRGQVKLDLVGHWENFVLQLLHRVK